MERKHSSRGYLEMGDGASRSSTRHPPPPPLRHHHVDVPPDRINRQIGKSCSGKEKDGSRHHHHDCLWHRPRGDRSESLKVIGGGGASDPQRPIRRIESEKNARAYEKLLTGDCSRAAAEGRTPPPPPPLKKREEEYYSTKYSYVRSPYQAMASELIDSLHLIEGSDANKCSCGVYVDDADLPRGWTFHRSTDPATYGRVVFSSPEGELSWNLPIEVALELSAEQQDVIRELIGRRPPIVGAVSVDCDGLYEGRGSGRSSSGQKVAHDRDTKRSKQASSATEINSYLEIVADE